MKSRIGTLDCLKFICAIGVVFLHTLNNAGLTPEDGFSYILCKGIYGTLAFLPVVEIFFIISAFLLFSRMHISDNRKYIELDFSACKKYIMRLLIIYACWSIFYLQIITENWPGRSIVHNLLSFIRHYLFGYSMQMWYVPSTIVGTIIIALILKFLNEKIAWIFAVVSFLFGLASSGYANIFQNPLSELWLKYFFSVALIRAPIYIMLGYTLAKNRMLKKRIVSIKKLAIGWGISGLLRLIEMKLSQDFHLGINADVTIFKPLSAFFAVCLCISLFDKYSKKLSEYSNVFAVLGSLSTTIYFSHVLFIEVIHYLIPKCNPALLFLMVSVLSSAIGLLLYKHKNIKLLRLLM